MDELGRYNKERWEELAQNRIVFSRPALDLTLETARKMVDPYHILGAVQGREVLCLASGGGQQSAAFGLLGARVTVLDLAETQLERDREAAAHYGLQVRTQQGDMRDLSCFDPGVFDVVWHAHSINFVPDARQVYREVARVLRSGGFYQLTCNNPYSYSLDGLNWTGEGYVIKLPYIDGAEIGAGDAEWEIWYEDGSVRKVLGPREFRHTLSTLINGLVELGFSISGLWEEGSSDSDSNPEPGSWEHLMRIVPPYLTIWARLGME